MPSAPLTSAFPAATLRHEVSERPPWAVLLGTLLLFFLRFGYDHGASDQDEIIPVLLHRLDPSLFAADWYVQTQAGGFTVRTYFLALLEGAARVVPVWSAVLVLHVASWLLVAAALFALTAHLTRDRIAASGAVLLALVLTPRWTLGGNDLVHTMLVPSALAWGLALSAVYLFLRERHRPAALLLGLACWFQLLVGLQIAGLVGLVWLVELLADRPGRLSWRAWLLFVLLFVAAAAPALVPVALAQLGGPSPGGEAAPSLFYILAEFRIPHHYLASAFPTASFARFGLLAAMALLLLAWPSMRHRLVHLRFVLICLAAIGVLCSCALFFTEGLRSLFVAQLQLFKLTVFAKVLFVALVANAVAALLPRTLYARLSTLLGSRALLVAVCLLWVAALAAATLPGAPLRGKVAPTARAATPLGQVERWARHETPMDAVFAVPPSVSSFRSSARRAILVNFKAVPFEPAPLRAWFERILDVAPLTPLPVRAGPDLAARLDEAYARQDADAWERLARRYGIRYLVVERTLEDAPFPVAFRAEPWIVYRIPSAASPSP